MVSHTKYTSIYISILPLFLDIFMQDVYEIFYELMLQPFISALTFNCYTIQYLCMCLQKWVTINWKRTDYRQHTPLDCFNSCTYSVIQKVYTLCLSKEEVENNKKNGLVWTQIKATKELGRVWHLLEKIRIAQDRNQPLEHFAILVSF